MVIKPINDFEGMPSFNPFDDVIGNQHFIFPLVKAPKDIPKLSPSRSKSDVDLVDVVGAIL